MRLSSAGPLLVGLALLAIVVPAAPSAYAADGTGGVRPLRQGFYLGAAVNPKPDETYPQALASFERKSGHAMTVHRLYQQWTSPTISSLTLADVADGRLPAISIDSPPWKQVAAGRHDREIVAQARAFKALRAPVLLTLNHEPEEEGRRMGTPAQYRAAWRHWVDIYRRVGVSNVSFTSIMLAYSFRHGAEVAQSYYPGDAYVDWIGVDGYNWFNVCQDTAWRDFASVFSDFRVWAARHHKPIFIAEVASTEDRHDPTRKADWIRDMGRTLKRWPQVKAVAWFEHYPTPEQNDCRFRVVSSPQSLRAWQAFVRTAFRRDEIPADAHPAD